MRSRQILAVSGDPQRAAELASALEDAGGIVEVLSSADELPPAGEAALCVADITAPLAEVLPGLLSRLSHGCLLVVLLPRKGLAAAVEALQTSERIAAVAIAEEIGAAQLTSLARRLLSGELAGARHALAESAGVQTILVHDYRERTQCIATISAFAEEHRLPARARAAVEQCIDEMLMNALYDAPVDDDGKHVFANVPVRTRITQRIEQTAVVQFGIDDARMTISVRDAYGSLERATVLRTIHKCLHQPDAVDRKAGGAGVGVYLMLNAASTVTFHVVPGLATEVSCTFEIASETSSLAHLAIITEREDVTGTLVSGRRPASKMKPVALTRSRVVPIAVAVVLLLAAAAGAFMYLRPTDEATPAELPPVLVLDSVPSGAAVMLDGKPAGETPLRVTRKAPGAEIVATLSLRGFEPSTVRARIPSAAPVNVHVQPLQRSPQLVHVRFVSQPPGARVVRAGQPASPTESRVYTPASLYLEAGQQHAFVLQMPTYLDLPIDPFTLEPGAATVEKSGQLTPAQ